MREAGLRTWLDAVGNVHGRVDGRARDAPALILGSHYDTVMDAGKYDGALGIIVAIASVKASILQVSCCGLCDNPSADIEQRWTPPLCVLLADVHTLSMQWRGNCLPAHYITRAAKALQMRCRAVR